jgi:uracil-DNA glycosylase family 4
MNSAAVSAPAERLDALAEVIRSHRECGFEPCETCTQMVPGEGSPTARIVFVGEAPGREEDLAGRPFVGRCGGLFDELLAVGGVARKEVFITNVLKARPPANRDPRAAEVAHSWPWLEAELELIRPRLLVPLGRHALERFVSHAKITAVHGTVLQAEGRTVYPMFHPAAGLRGRSVHAALLADASRLQEALSAAAP